MARLSERKSGALDNNGSTPPIGTIMAYVPGYYTGGANTGFTITGPGGNTVSDANAHLPDNWKVCDGTALNDADSPIWNAAGRHLPELTDSRFMRGATASGNSGGANTKTLNTPQLPSHSHSASSGTANAPHGHSASPNGGVSAPATATHSHNLSPSGQVLKSGAGPNAGLPLTGGSYNLGSIAGANAPHNQPHNTPAGNVPGANAPHSHPISVTSTGSGDSFDIQPNYVNVFYIIRVK